MSQSSSHDNALSLDQVADEFLARLRGGECPSIEEFVARYPDLAADIAELFPTLASLEHFDAQQDRPQRILGFNAPERLGDYRIIREVGRGGMGVVYEARHDTMKRRVALKVLPSSGSDGRHAKRFLREARSAGQLHHTNIVPVFEVGEANGVYYYAMQFIHGQNLDVVLEELRQMESASQSSTLPAGQRVQMSPSTTTLWTGHRPDDSSPATSDPQPSPGPSSDRPPTTGSVRYSGLSSADPATKQTLPGKSADSSYWRNSSHQLTRFFRRVARGAIQVADALEFAHNHGVLHRDIKPSNLILDTDGVLWVSDFGLAKDDSEDLTHTGDIIGTLRYMAPERFTGEADRRSDIYSLGLTLYEMCVLKYAFEETDRARLMQQITHRDPIPPRKLRPEIPLDLETIIIKAIAREPAARYQTSRQMAEDLGRFLADKPVLARRVSVTEKAWRWCRRNPGYATLLGCISVLCALMIIGALGFAFKTQQYAGELQEKTNRAVAAEQEAKQASRDSSNSLYASYVGHANASRWSRRLGQRFETLTELGNAARLLPTLGRTAHEIDTQRLALRNSAIAAMPLADIREIRKWPTNSPAGALLSNDGRRIAWSEDDGRLQIRDVDSGQVVATFAGPSEQAWVIGFDADTKFIAAKFHDDVPLTHPKLLVWEIATGQKRLDLRENLGNASFAFHPTEPSISVCRRNGDIEVYSLEDGRLLATHPTGHDATRMDYDMQGNIGFLTGGNQVDVIEADSGKRSTIPMPVGIHSFTWTVNNDLVVGGRNGTVFFRDAATEGIREIGRHTSNVAKLSLSGLDRLLTSEAWSGTKYLHDIQTGETLLSLDRFSVDGMARDANRIALSEESRFHSVWEVATGGPFREIQKTPGQRTWQVAPHPIHESILALAVLGHMEVWDIDQEILLLSIEAGDITELVFRPDGHAIYTAFAGAAPPKIREFHVERNPAGDWQVVIGEPEPVPGLQMTRPPGFSNHLSMTASGNCIAGVHQMDTAHVVTLDNPGGAVEVGRHSFLARVALHPDGTRLVTTTWKGEGVRLWDAVTGEFLVDLAPDCGSGWAQFSPDGKWLVVASSQADMIWDTDTWTKRVIDRAAFSGDAGRIAFSPDSQLAVVWKTEFVPRLIDPVRAVEVATLEAPDRKSGTPAFSQSGDRLIIGTGDSLQIWDLQHLRRELASVNLDWP